MTGDPEPRVGALVAAAPGIDAAGRAELLHLAEAAAIATDGVLVSTCHRVELLVDDPWLHDDSTTDLIAAGMTRLSGPQAAHHIIDLALGLESAVVGEDQILHQLRDAVAQARQRRALGADLDALLDRALHAGRLGRSWRPARASMGGSSLADLAVARVEAALGSVTGRRILVVGAGEMGQAVASAATDRGATVWLASRSRERATAAADRIGVTTWSIDPGRAILEIDAVIVALAGQWTMGAATAEAVASRAVVVDLSMPQALPASVQIRLGERLIDIDQLATTGALDGPQTRYRDRLERLANRTLASYLAALAARERSGAERLAQRVERQRTQELEAYLRQRPELDDAARALIDEATRDLSARLFREPLARLASDPDGRRGRALEELFGA